jgi:hypothetical protein
VRYQANNETIVSRSGRNTEKALTIVTQSLGSLSDGSIPLQLTWMLQPLRLVPAISVRFALNAGGGKSFDLPNAG